MKLSVLPALAAFAFLGAIVFPACKDKDTGGKETGDSPDDSGGDDSGDTNGGDDSGDTNGGDTDSGETGTLPPSNDISYDLDGTSFMGMTVSLVSIDPATISPHGLTFGETFDFKVIDADPLEWTLTPPADEALYDFDATSAPGLKVGVYVPTMFMDSNGDGEATAAEVYTGIGKVWLAYLKGPLPEALTTAGARSGWNAVTVSLVGGLAEATFGTPLGMQLRTNLLVNGVMELGGTYDGTGTRMGVIPMAELTGTGVETLLVDQELSATWTATLEAAPDADHGVPDGSLGFAAIEVPVSYVDNDSSGDWTDGDEVEYYACLDNKVVMVAYLTVSNQIRECTERAMMGFTPGWSAFKVNGDTYEVITADKYGTLALSGDCSL